MLIELLKSVLFGIVEGITEWLPISSTGHMILLQSFISMDVSEDFWDVFLVVIQLGAILAVIGRYFRELNPFAPSKGKAGRKETWRTWAKIVIGTIPAAVVGVLLNDWAEAHIMNALVVAIALIAYGIVFLIIEYRSLRKTPLGKHSKAAAAGTDSPKVEEFHELSFGKSFLIGCFQALAVVPGTSRSGSIIIGSMLLGTSRTIATEFAFFLAIPIMLGWSIIKFLRHGFAYTGMEWAILAVGCVVAFLVSWFCIRFLVDFVRKHTFIVFGWYRIILGVVVIAFFAFTGQLLTIQAG